MGDGYFVLFCEVMVVFFSSFFCFVVLPLSPVFIIGGVWPPIEGRPRFFFVEREVFLFCYTLDRDVT